jgi:cathepsin L
MNLRLLAVMIMLVLVGPAFAKKQRKLGWWSDAKSAVSGAVNTVVNTVQSAADIALAAIKKDPNYKSWLQFKADFGKKYSGYEEEARRLKIFVSNLQYVVSHNALQAAGGATFGLKINQFADLATSEWQSLAKGRIAGAGRRLMDNRDLRAWGRGSDEPVVSDADFNSLPSEFFWTDKGKVAPVENQGSCGSCWSFAAAGALEAHIAIADNNAPVPLSKQNLLDCVSGVTCSTGGNVGAAYNYIIDKGGVGLLTASADGYLGNTNGCQANEALNSSNGGKLGNSNRKLVGWRYLPKNDERTLKYVIAKKGPAAVAIDASSIFFQLYWFGVYDPLFSSSCCTMCNDNQLDHAVLVTGYGRELGKDYWHIKNSWGTWWGWGGYVKIVRGGSQKCGVATSPMYPLVQ